MESSFFKKGATLKPRKENIFQYISLGHFILIEMKGKFGFNLVSYQKLSFLSPINQNLKFKKVRYLEDSSGEYSHGTKYFL